MDVREFTKPSGTVAAGTVPDTIETPKQQATDLVAPVDEMLEYLRAVGIKDQDIFNILDTILTEGTVVWNFKVLNKIPVVFQMRTAWMNEILVKALEDEAPKTVARFSDIVAKHNMAGSLIKYNSNEVPVGTPDEYYANMDAVAQLPHTIYTILVKQLSIFDKVVAVATSTWALENFTKLS
jgi:hypothetical protein